MSFLKRFSALALIAALVACGSNHHNDQSSANGQSQSNQNAAGIMTGSPASPLKETTPVGGSSAGAGSSMVGVAAPTPSVMSCGSAQPVWVNERSHVYHEPADPLYGHTKHGKYMCPSDAIASGYHLAKAHHGGRYGSAGSMAEPSPAST